MTDSRVKLALLALIIGGCTNYYKIHDPTTGNDYYTTEYDQARDGSVTFIDSISDNEITIQNSAIEELDDEDDYKEAKGAAREAGTAAGTAVGSEVP
jgi:hypothetical protein